MIECASMNSLAALVQAGQPFYRILGLRLLTAAVVPKTTLEWIRTVRACADHWLRILTYHSMGLPIQVRTSSPRSKASSVRAFSISRPW